MNNITIAKALMSVLFFLWLAGIDSTLSRILDELKKMNERESKK